MAGIWLAGRRGKGGDRERCHCQEEQRRHRPNRWRVESLGPMTEAADEERQAKDEQQVREDRADQGGLDDDHETGPQGEDRDEELGQVAERRLEDARRRRPESLAELVGALPDQHRQAGEGNSTDDEDDRLAGAKPVEGECDNGRRDRDDGDDAGRPTKRGGQRGKRLHRRRISSGGLRMSGVRGGARRSSP